MFGEGHGHFARACKLDVRLAAAVFAVDFGGNHSRIAKELSDVLLSGRERQTLQFNTTAAAVNRACSNSHTRSHAQTCMRKQWAASDEPPKEAAAAEWLKARAGAIVLKPPP